MLNNGNENDTKKYWLIKQGKYAYLRSIFVIFYILWYNKEGPVVINGSLPLKTIEYADSCIKTIELVHG